MKKTFIIISILFISYLSFGQKNEFYVGVLGSVDNYNFDVQPSFVSALDNYAYSYGISTQYNFKKRLFLKGSFQYSRKEFQLDYNFYTVEPGPPDPLIPNITNLNTSYLSIPFLIGYYIQNGEKIKTSISCGIVSEFLLTEKETSVFQDDTKRKSEFLNQDLNKVQISPQINIALEYHLENNLFIAFEPYLRYYLDTNANDFMEAKPLVYGGILSINYKLR